MRRGLWKRKKWRMELGANDREQDKVEIKRNSA